MSRFAVFERETVFQHTAARRRLANRGGRDSDSNCVSTHSRPKAAGFRQAPDTTEETVSTHSRPKAAG